MVPTTTRRVAPALLVLIAAAAAGCSGAAERAASDDPSASSSTSRPSSRPSSEPARGTGSAPPAPVVAVPLAVAVHPTRDGLALSGAQLARLSSGDVRSWSQLGEPGGRLVVGDLAAVRRSPDAVALVPARALGPRAGVARVDGVDPVRRPREYAPTVDVAGPSRLPERVTTVTVTGDLMLGRRVGDRLAAIDEPAGALRPMAGRLAAADLAIGNLESTLSKAGAPRQGGDSFGASPAVRAGLRLAGFDVLSLANNHSGDYGPRALMRTVQRLRDGGFAPVGAGADLAAASRPVVVERKGTTFGIVAFDAIGETPAATAASPGTLRVRMQPRTGPLDHGDLDRVLRIVRRLDRQVDVVLVMPHWGTQYTHATVRDQRVVARALVRAGADVVAGGHPHWVQGVEAVGDGLVAYSLGNFVFDMDFMQQTQEGVLLELTFWDAELKNARLVPYVIGADFAPRAAPGARGAALLADVWRASAAPLGGTHAG
jgi:poly-gamma-glutamate capsule biosynthesis protein CapA/YwtB (metallophosphatase superfamily)